GDLALADVGRAGGPAVVHHLDPEQAQDEDDADEDHRRHQDVLALVEVHRARASREVSAWARRQSSSVAAALIRARRRVVKKSSKRYTSMKNSQRWWSTTSTPAKVMYQVRPMCGTQGRVPGA